MTLWRYEHVHNYLTWARAAFAYTRAGGTVRTNWAGADLDAGAFSREFVKALNTRINLKAGLPVAVNLPQFICVYHVAPDGHVFSYGGSATEGRYIGWRKLDGDYLRNIHSALVHERSERRASALERLARGILGGCNTFRRINAKHHV